MRVRAPFGLHDDGATVQGPPTLASLDVSSGTEVGATVVVATGTNLNNVTGVTVGGVAATSVSSTATTCTFTTPANAAALSSTAADNARDVVVTTPQGSATLSGGYSYTSEFARILGATLVNEWRANDPRITLNSGNVSNWPDFRGNGDAAQGTASLQPAFGATAFNGGPGVTGDGVNDYLLSTFGTPIAASSRPYVWWIGQWVTATAGRRSGVLSDAGFTNDFLDEHINGTNFALYRGGAGVSRVEISGADTNRHLWEGGYTASGTNAFVLDGTGANSPNTGTTGADLTRIVMFAAPGPSAYGNFRLVARLIANAEPSAGNKTAMRTAIKSTVPWIGYTANSLGLP